MLVGGTDKQVPLERLCRELARRARVGSACYRTIGPLLGWQIAGGDRRQAAGYKVVERLEVAGLRLVLWTQSRPGDTILLSPAAASLDQFRDFVNRAEAFRAWIASQTRKIRRRFA